MSSIKIDDEYNCEGYVNYLFPDENFPCYQLPPESYCRGRVLKYNSKKYFLIECLSEDENQLLNESLLIPFNDEEELNDIKNILAINIAYELQFGNIKVKTNTENKNFVGCDHYYITELKNIEIVVNGKIKKLESIDKIKKELNNKNINYSFLPLESTKRLFKLMNGDIHVSNSIIEFVYNYQCYCGWINALMNKKFDINKISSYDIPSLPIIDNKWIKTFIEFLDSFKEAKDDLIVWRRIENYDLDSDSFISTSLNKKFSNGWNHGYHDNEKLKKIIIPKGSHFFPIISIEDDKFLNEGEILLFPATFSYNQKNDCYIYLEKDKNEILLNLLYQLKNIKREYLELKNENTHDYDLAIEELGQTIFRK